MTSFSLFRRFVIILVFAQFGFTVGARAPKQIQHVSKEDAEKILTERIMSVSKEQLVKGAVQAAKRLQSNFAKAMGTFSRKNVKEVPADVRNSAKMIVQAVKSGKLTGAFTETLPAVLSHVSNQANPAQQLQTIIKDLLPRAPLELKGPLEGVMTFLKANLAGANTLLTRLLAGAPNLLNGVVTSLASTLGGVNAAVMGSVESLNSMVGGLLSTLPVNGLLQGGAGGLLGGAGGLLGG